MEEQEILDELYRDHSERLVGYVNNFLRSKTEAEEVVQESFLKLHAILKTTKIISHKAYLYRIAHNLAMKSLRRRKVVKIDDEINMQEVEVAADEPLADQQISSRQEYKIFCEAVETLSPKCQKAFILRMVYKKSFKQVAEELDIAVSTAEKHVLKGMRECQKYMEKANRKKIGSLKKVTTTRKQRIV